MGKGKWAGENSGKTLGKPGEPWTNRQQMRRAWDA